LGQPGRARAAVSRAAGGTVRWSFGLSLVLHAMAIGALLLLAHHAVTPEAEVAPIELVMLPAEPESAPAPPAAAETVPEQQAAPEPPPPEPPPPEPPPPEPPPPEPPPPEPPPPEPPPPEPPPPEPPPPEPPPPEAPPKPRPVPAPQPARQAPARTNSPPRALPPLTQTAGVPSVIGPQAPASPAPAAPPQQAVRTGADPGWLAGVSAWLAAHRTYPEMARTLGRQGTVVVQITVDPDGHVEDVTLVQGSGTESLDHAAEALVRGAHLPPFPADMKVAHQTVTIPIHYRLE
jgi:periplasmic protein TonB